MEYSKKESFHLNQLYIPKKNEKRYTFSVGDYIEWEYFHEHSADKSLYGKTFTASIISIDYEYDQYHILAEYGYDYIPFVLARKSYKKKSIATTWRQYVYLPHLRAVSLQIIDKLTAETKTF